MIEEMTIMTEVTLDMTAEEITGEHMIKVMRDMSEAMIIAKRDMTMEVTGDMNPQGHTTPLTTETRRMKEVTSINTRERRKTKERMKAAL